MFDNISEIKKKYINVIKEVESEFENEIFYKNHVLTSQIHKIEDNDVYIIVDNDFIKDTLKEYVHFFDEAFARNFHQTLNTIFITKQEKDTKVLKASESKSQNNTLDKTLNFDSLVVGIFNENVVKAANMILENTATWNSLFIYGSTGLGKTHLLNAIGNKFVDLYPEKNVLYIQTEDFNRNVYSAFSKSGIEIEKYKDSFLDVDLLLVDDVQFLSNKEKMNEVFFTIFNKLISNKKIVIMTSDKIPNALVLDDRMVSRFNSGLQIKIGKPDTDSIRKIIINKLNTSGRKNQFSKNAVDFLVSRFNADIRVLEGIINKIIFHSLMTMSKEEIINEDKLKEIMESDSDFDYVSKNLSINPEILIETVCIAYNVDMKSVVSKKRNKEFSFPRKVCMYLLREKLSYSYNQIGSFFSNRNHSTVLESIKSVEDKLKEDKNFSNFMDNLMSKF